MRRVKPNTGERLHVWTPASPSLVAPAARASHWSGWRRETMHRPSFGFSQMRVICLIRAGERVNAAKCG